MPKSSGVSSLAMIKTDINPITRIDQATATALMPLRKTLPREWGVLLSDPSAISVNTPTGVHRPSILQVAVFGMVAEIDDHVLIGLITISQIIVISL